MRSAFRVLAKLKGLRGTALDPFGRTDERRTERALIEQYKSCITELMSGGALTADRLALAVEIARIPEDIRGYGHVKARHLAAARPKWDALMARWRQGDDDSTAGATAKVPPMSAASSTTRAATTP
jgi:indolepyruvate ferredoxin oxidoreductase